MKRVIVKSVYDAIEYVMDHFYRRLWYGKERKQARIITSTG